jgi:hypothetical protein
MGCARLKDGLRGNAFKVGWEARASKREGIYDPGRETSTSNTNTLLSSGYGTTSLLPNLSHRTTQDRTSFSATRIEDQDQDQDRNHTTSRIINQAHILIHRRSPRRHSLRAKHPLEDVYRIWRLVQASIYPFCFFFL